LRGKRGIRKKTLGKQRVRRKKRSRVWVMTARVLGSTILKIGLGFAVVVLVSLVFIYSYHYVLTSPFFGLKQLNITGLDSKEQERLVKVCCLREGQNILALRLGELRKKIEADPWIRSARVERKLPGTLSISVVKEEPWAIVVSEDFYFMNRWGEIFKKVEGQDPVNLPVVTGLSDLGSEAGEELRQVASLLSILSAEKGAIGLMNLLEIHINDSRNFSLYFKGIPAEIQMGAMGLRIQVAKLRRLLRHLKDTGRMQEARRIDLQYAGGAVVSFYPPRRINGRTGKNAGNA